MTRTGLERALGMRVLDAAFCDRFLVNPGSAVWQAGRPLSPIEVEALARVSRAAIVRFREALEPSLRRSRQTDAALAWDPPARGQTQEERE
jgi:hypothetical protein